MSRDNNLQVFNSYLGVDVSCIEALRKSFCKHASRRESPPSGDYVVISNEVYDEFIRLYHQSLNLADALHDVFEDGEHQLVIEEAKSLGYKLPDLNLFEAELQGYREYLYGLDPYDVKSGAPDYKKAPMKALDDFKGVMNYNCLMISRIFSGCFQTEYMKRFGDLKQAGFPYVGATALQEAVDVVMQMTRVVNEIDKHIKSRSERFSWKPPENRI